MVALRAFAYTHRNTAVHALDPRLKLLALAAFSIAALALPAWAARGVLATALLGGYFAARLSPLRALLGARVFLALAVVVVLTHSLRGGALSASGAEAGARIASGFLLVLLAAELTMQTTPASRVTDVVHWALRPVPGVNGGRVALMAGLALRHAAVLGQSYRRVRDAMKVRGLQSRRAPVRTVRLIALALIRETVLAAERTTDALAARHYSDDRTPPAFRLRLRDALALALVAAVIAIAGTVSPPLGP